MDGLAQEAQINRQQMLRQAEPYRTYLALYLWTFKDQLPRESTTP
jgi:3-methyladenine DNA glycosylase/8-oxoguanine DNA glycosylase